MKSDARRPWFVLAAVAIAAILAPVGVRAANNLFVLKDADSNQKAQVDSGKLRVGDGNGALNVAGEIGINPAANDVRITAAPGEVLPVDEVSSPPQRVQKTWSTIIEDSANGACTFGYAVPDDKLLVIEYVSVWGNSQSGADFLGANLTADGGTQNEELVIGIPLREEAPDNFAGGESVYGVSIHGSNVKFCISRSGSTGSDTITSGFSGYLEDDPSA